MATKKEIPKESLDKMEKYGVNQKKMADIFKVSQSTVSRKMKTKE